MFVPYASILRERVAAGHDFRKNTIYLCIMAHSSAIIFENKYAENVLNPLADFHL